MTTNILALLTVALITNVVQTDNAYRSQINYMLDGFPPQYQIITPATEQYLTTTITRRTTMTGSYDGIDLSAANDKLLSSVTKVLRLKQQWEDAGVKTNDVAPPVWTNAIFLNGIDLTNIFIKP